MWSAEDASVCELSEIGRSFSNGGSRFSFRIPGDDLVLEPSGFGPTAEQKKADCNCGNVDPVEFVSHRFLAGLQWFRPSSAGGFGARVFRRAGSLGSGREGFDEVSVSPGFSGRSLLVVVASENICVGGEP